MAQQARRVSRVGCALLGMFLLVCPGVRTFPEAECTGRVSHDRYRRARAKGLFGHDHFAVLEHVGLLQSRDVVCAHRGVRSLAKTMKGSGKTMMAMDQEISAYSAHQTSVLPKSESSPGRPPNPGCSHPTASMVTVDGPGAW